MSLIYEPASEESMSLIYEPAESMSLIYEPASEPLHISV